MALNETLITVLNSTPVLTEFITSTHVALNTMKYLVGGLFGWYIIYTLISIQIWRKNREESKKLRKEIKKLRSELKKFKK